MGKTALRKTFYLIIIIITVLLMVGLWVLSASNMEDKVPSRGVFVYSKEFLM